MSKYERQLSEEIRRNKTTTIADSFALSDDKAPLRPSYGSLHHALLDSSQEWQIAVQDFKSTKNDGKGESSTIQENEIENENSISSRHDHRSRRGGRSTRSDPYDSIIGPDAMSRLLMNIMVLCVIFYTILILIGPPIILETIPKSRWCPTYSERMNLYSNNSSLFEEPIVYENPDHNNDPCHCERIPLLFFLTMEEADCCRRMLLSVIMGGFIGFERRSSDRPAGVRTMGLVSLGACFFTISSQLAFKDSTMGWDASRVAAAIPSGVGFLGAGLIWTGTVGSGKEERQEVHGLTTAAGVWLSAAIGTGCGGQLYFVSGYSCILVTMILRYGPKIYIEEKNDDGDDDDDDMDDTDDDDVIGDDKKDETESNINYSSASNINKGMEMTTKNGMGRQLQRDGNSNMTRPQTMSMEGVRVALVDADELKMFEAWKRERERQQSASTRTRTRGSTNESPRRRPLSRNTGVVGISCVGYDDDDLSCSESSRD